MGELRQSQWKIGRSSKTYADVHRTVLLLCYISLLGFIAALRISLPFMWQWKKSFEFIRSHVPRTLKCNRFEQSPTWLVPSRAELSQRRSFSWELNGPHKPDSSETDKMCFHSGSIYLPSVLLSFHPSVFPSCPLSLSLPLSLHSSPPCNQGPLKWAEETD